RFQQIRDEEAVHLEKGEMADAVRKSAGLVNEVARPGQFKTIFLFIEQKQAFQFGNRFAEKPGQFGWRLGKVSKRHVQSDLPVLRIREGFDFLRLRRQISSARQFLQSAERLGEQRGEYGTVV